VNALDVYEEALGVARHPLIARSGNGGVRRLPVERWTEPAGPVDERVLARARSPVLDIGCGPGRHTRALARRRVPALGVDVSREAVRRARQAGADALHASVFDRLPEAGAWRCALLLDGNVGIGGCPSALFARISFLLAADGDVLVEVEPPGAPTGSVRMRLEHRERCSTEFPWAFASADTVAADASGAGLHVTERWSDGGRWFVRLERR
jgi:SAM-dependent methyltransferase